MNRDSRAAHRRPGRPGAGVLRTVVLLVLTAVAVIPLIILLMDSVKSQAQIGENAIGPPSSLHLENFVNAWTQGHLGMTATSSLILVVLTVSIELVLSGLAAYSLARKRPFGHDGVMIYMLVATTIPVWLYVVPLFFLWRALGLVNSRFGLSLIYVALNAPFAIFLLRSYLVGLSPDFEDAARIDGANELQVLYRIIVPLSWPAFLTVGLIVGLGVWGEFQLALIFINDPNKMPVTTSFFAYALRFGTNWATTSAAGVMIIVPILALFLAMQRRFIEGLTEGGLKM